MSELPVRYRISEAVFNAQSGNISDATEAILTIIRTALLSEPAVDAAMAVVEYRSQEATAAQDWKEERDDWKEAVTAAWDSVMGESDEGEWCDCEFDEYEEGDEQHGEKSWHFRRMCQWCDCIWYSIHCPHDGCQNPCPECGIVPTVVKTAQQP